MAEARHARTGTPAIGPETRVLITGAASGLGAALARACNERGARVLTTDLGGPVDLILDITSDEDWAAAAEWVQDRWGGLDVLVNNAGVAGGGRVELCDLDEWRWIFEINLYGVVRGCRAFVPLLPPRAPGEPPARIVNVASLAGLVHPAGMGSYNAVKAAVVAFTETLGHELAGRGVRAHAVCPSYFRTNLGDSMQGADTAVGEIMARLVADSAVSADDIAAGVLEGLDRDEELILPDDAARMAYALKLGDRESYDAIMRAQAAKLPPL